MLTLPIRQVQRTSLSSRKAFSTCNVLRLASPATSSSTSSSASLSGLSLERAKEVESKWKGTNTSGGKIPNFVGGEWVQSNAKQWLDVNDPVSTEKEKRSMGWRERRRRRKKGRPLASISFMVDRNRIFDAEVDYHHSLRRAISNRVEQ